MIIDISGPAVPRLSRRAMASFVRGLLRRLGRAFDELSIALVDDRIMRRLNHEFRGKDRTTDVLTFPDARTCEIVISVDQARRQAAVERHSLATEIRYLLLHGILHGLGYDHETDHGEMDALELRLRLGSGL